VEKLSGGILSGADLYGDDFSPGQIAEWYADEEQGYYNLREDLQYGDEYKYRAMNDFHALSWLRKRKYDTCLAIGCANGDDIASLGPNVNRFIAVEPAERWWRDEIGGSAATFVKPELSGHIPVEDASIDLAISFGTLHHIPNVSMVVSEIARALKPGGIFVVREPCNSMGDWRKPRVGLTQRERGIPTKWMSASLASSGLKVIRKRYCQFPIINKFPVQFPYNSKPLVVLDWALSTIASVNDRYWRDSTLKKVAPSSFFIIASKASNTS
jgi:SAM-dependent methyltransferase